jgi:hypothetical protein
VELGCFTTVLVEWDILVVGAAEDKREDVVGEGTGFVLDDDVDDMSTSVVTICWISSSAYRQPSMFG